MKRTAWRGVLVLILILGQVTPSTLSAHASEISRPPAVSEDTLTALPLTLRDCYELALKQSEQIAILKEEIEIAEAQALSAMSEGLGDINFIMSNTQQQKLGGGEGGVSGSFTRHERRERKFTVTQPLFQGLKAFGAITGAGSFTKQRKEEYERAKELLFLDVARAFYDILKYDKERTIIQEILTLFNERIEELTGREQIGRSRPSEIANARARMKALEADWARTAGLLAGNRYVLEFLTGINISINRLQDEESPDQDPKRIQVDLSGIEWRSDVEAARQAVKMANKGIIVAQSGLWPEISLEYNHYEKREGIQGLIDWDLLFKIDVPIFKGFETSGKIKQAVSDWKQAKLTRRLAMRQAALEIKQAHENWLSKAQEYEALEESVRASHDNFKLQREDYERNLVSNLEVLDALESLHAARRSANEVYYDMKYNYWNWKVALGETL